MGSYTGHPPFLDEYIERIENSEHLQVGTKGMKQVTLLDASGNPITLPSTGTTPTSGTTTVTTAGTAVQITATPTTIKGVWLNADLIAGIVVTVGDSAVKGNASGMKGVVLTPGNQPIFLAITDLSTLWVDAQNNGGKLAWLSIS